MGNTPDGYQLIPSGPDKTTTNIQGTSETAPVETLTPTEDTPTNITKTDKQHPGGHPIGSMSDVLRLLQNCKNDRELDMLETLIGHHDKLLTTKWFQASRLLDWYSSNLNLIYKGDRKSEILAKIMPTNDRDFMWTLYRNRTPIPILKIITPKISLDKLNDKKETFLFQKFVDKFDLNVNYMTDLIEQMPDIPIHQVNCDHRTFLHYILTTAGVWNSISKDTWKRFFGILSDRDFKFINTTIDRQLLISYLMASYPEYVFEYNILVSPKSCDLTEDCSWLISLFTHHSEYNQHNYVWELIRRDDHVSFLCKSYRNARNVFGIEYFKFIMKCYRLNKSKILAMLQYTDELGNTVIHYMAHRHDKTLLQPIMTVFGSMITIAPNLKGQTPKQLYESSKLSALLS